MKVVYFGVSGSGPAVGPAEPRARLDGASPSNAATPRQRVIETTLAGQAARKAEPPPSLGPMAALRPRLDWLGKLGEG